jgi:hypothetical protein
MLPEGGDSMVFAKLWLLGLLVAVLIVAATPPTWAPIIVRNETPAQEQVTVVPAAQPCPDMATAQVAAAEERLNGLVERNRQELKNEIAQAATSATRVNEHLSQVDGNLSQVGERLSQIEERLRVAESQATERKADVESIRGKMAAPLVVTWVLAGLAAVVAVLAGYGVLRARRARGERNGSAAKP